MRTSSLKREIGGWIVETPKPSGKMRFLASLPTMAVGAQVTLALVVLDVFDDAETAIQTFQLTKAAAGQIDPAILLAGTVTIDKGDMSTMSLLRKIIRPPLDECERLEFQSCGMLHFSQSTDSVGGSGR